MISIHIQMVRILLNSCEKLKSIIVTFKSSGVFFRQNIHHIFYKLVYTKNKQLQMNYTNTRKFIRFPIYLLESLHSRQITKLQRSHHLLCSISISINWISTKYHSLPVASTHLDYSHRKSEFLTSQDIQPWILFMVSPSNSTTPIAPPLAVAIS